VKIKRATTEDSQEIFHLTQDTIRAKYKNVYKQYQIDFFSDIHSKEAIEKDIAKGIVYILLCDNIILATATLAENHIMRVFVEKSHIGRGYGSKIMDFVEREVARNYDEIVLESSLVAEQFYIRRGYINVSRDFLEINDGRILEYNTMKKFLTAGRK